MDPQRKLIRPQSGGGDWQAWIERRMTNSKISKRDQRPQKLWLPSLLLLAQFLTITPVLLIVFANEQQRKASDGYLKLLDGLERLSFAIAEWENGPRPGAKQDSSATVAEVNRLLRASAPSPQVVETLSRVDSIVARMAQGESVSKIREDGRAARSELLNAQRLVRLELSTSGASIAEQSTYLKALVAGACLLAFGVVFVVRRFRVDAAIQRNLQKQLRATNEEVIAALAAARSESDSKNQFLVHVGHLMRTPLNAIVARMGEPFEAAETLKNLAGQVVDYARLDSGKLELQCMEFEPATIVAQVLELFMPAANRKHLTLKSSVEKDLPRVVKGDPERLRQVLVNLVSNAVRCTEKGEILLRLEETVAAEERTVLRFEVKDSGIGISEAVRNRLFQPFGSFQPIDSANQENGLGLAISKKLVELMGGKIEIVDAPGRGCTFAFTAVFERVHRKVAEAKPAGSRSHPEKKNRRERRAERRHGTNYPTLLRAQSAGIAVIRVLDVSASGLRVSVPFRLIPRTEVEIRIEGTSVVGIVRNCAHISANEFHVGILIPRETSEDEQERLNHLSLLRIVRVVDDDGDLDEEGLVNKHSSEAKR
jgi:signal transduction histidine kinase